MQQLILKNKISKSKMEALIYFLKSWDIVAEVKTIKEVIAKKPVRPSGEKTTFSLSAGLWKAYSVD